MNELRRLFPDPQVIIDMPPQELAGVLLPILAVRGRHQSLYNFVNSLRQAGTIYEQVQAEKVADAISEAWAWMLANGLLAPEAGQAHGDFVFVSRRGHEVVAAGSFEPFRKTTLLPRGILHPKIAEKAWPNFMRGDYDTAVFQAFKEVEVAVRAAVTVEARIVGTDLMRVAFHTERGALSDMTLPAAERESLAHLFAGAIGSYKNPSSHRTVTIADPVEAGEMLILASHLLRIVNDRVAKRTAAPTAADPT